MTSDNRSIELLFGAPSGTNAVERFGYRGAGGFIMANGQL
jgi:hypothetical protein